MRAVAVAAMAALAMVGAAVLVEAAEDGAGAINAGQYWKHKLNPQVFRAMLDDMAETSKMSGKTLRRTMGGAVNNDGYKNTCVIRISHAWNAAAKKFPQSWAEIPTYSKSKYKRDQSLARNGGAASRTSTEGGIYSVKDKHGRNTALRVMEMHDWMAQVWGPPTHTNKEQIKRDSALGGIIMFLNCKWGASTATAHLDLYFNGRCSNKCYFENCSTVKLYAANGAVPCSVRAKSGTVSGVCRDQELCVLEAEGKPFSNWPVMEKGQCGGMGSRVKCCVKGGFAQRS